MSDDTLHLVRVLVPGEREGTPIMHQEGDILEGRVPRIAYRDIERVAAERLGRRIDNAEKAFVTRAAEGHVAWADTESILAVYAERGMAAAVEALEAKLPPADKDGPR